MNNVVKKIHHNNIFKNISNSLYINYFKTCLGLGFLCTTQSYYHGYSQLNFLR